MAFQEQVDKLIDKLTELSRQNKVKWKETVDQEDTFAAPIAKYRVTICRIASGLDPVTFQLRVFDSLSRVLEEATLHELNSLAENVTDEDLLDVERLSELHSLARRSALNTDEALSDLLVSLDQIR